MVIDFEKAIAERALKTIPCMVHSASRDLSDKYHAGKIDLEMYSIELSNLYREAYEAIPMAMSLVLEKKETGKC